MYLTIRFQLGNTRMPCLMDEYIAQLKEKGIQVVSQNDKQLDIILGVEKKKDLALFVQLLMGRSGRFETVFVITGDECFQALGIDPAGPLTPQEANCHYGLDKGSFYIALRREGDLDLEKDNLALLITYDEPLSIEYCKRLANTVKKAKAQTGTQSIHQDVSQSFADGCAQHGSQTPTRESTLLTCAWFQTAPLLVASSFQDFLY